MRGAALLALLTAPPASACDEATLRALRYWHRILPEILGAPAAATAVALELAVPTFEASCGAEATRGLGQMTQAINQRLGAAHAAHRFLADAEARLAGGAGHRGRQLSIDGELAHTLAADAENEEHFLMAGAASFPSLSRDLDSFDKRAVRPSLPVLPLTFALTWALERITAAARTCSPDHLDAVGSVVGQSGREFHFGGLLGHILRDGGMQTAWLERAEAIEWVVPAMRKLRPPRLVRVRLTDRPAIARPLLPLATPMATVTRAAGAAISVDLAAGASGAQRAIVLLATLATPPVAPDDAAWRRTVAAFSRLAWQGRCEADPETARRPQPVIAPHLRVPLRVAERTVRDAIRELERRLAAARILAPAVQMVAGGAPLSVEGRAARWSLAGAIRTWLERERGLEALMAARGASYSSPWPTGGHAVANTETRVVRPARPVLHLAIAFAFMLGEIDRDAAQGIGRAGSSSFTWQSLLDRPEQWTTAVFQLAAALEEAVIGLPAGGPAAAELIRLRQAPG